MPLARIEKFQLGKLEENSFKKEKYNQWKLKIINFKISKKDSNPIIINSIKCAIMKLKEKTFLSLKRFLIKY